MCCHNYLRHICCCIISGLRKYFEIKSYFLQFSGVLLFTIALYERGTPGHFFFKTYFWICNSMVVFPGPGRAYFSLKSHLKFDEIEKMKHCRFFGQYCRWTILCRKEGYIYYIVRSQIHQTLLVEHVETRSFIISCN